MRWVQISLNQILGLRLPITGVMNAAARSALRTFQGQQNLPADGIAGPETRKALLEAKAKPSGRGDEPSGSAQSQQPSQSGPSEEPSPSAPSEEPSSSGPSQEPTTQEPSQPGEFEWSGADEFEWAGGVDRGAEHLASEQGASGPSVTRRKRLHAQDTFEVEAFEGESESGDMSGTGRWVRRGKNIVVLLNNRATRSDYELDEVPLVAKTGAAAAVAAQAQKVAAYARAAISAEKTCWVQTVLSKAESENLNADGIQGPLTRGAIRRFQARNSLSVDGIVGPRTETALVQTALNSLAQASLLPANGVVDARTSQEIKRFQARQELVPDGIVGPRTRGAMVVALGGRCVGPAPSSRTKPAKPAQWVQTKSSCNKADYARRVNQCIEDSKKCFIAAHEVLALAAAACLATRRPRRRAWRRPAYCSWGGTRPRPV